MLALRRNPSRGAVSAPVTIPAPVGGLNARDSLATMPVEDAVQLENIFPQPNYVELRRGYSSHRNGMAGPVRTLMAYAAPSGSDELLACAGDTIWDVTSAGSAASALSSGYTNVDFQHVNFSTSAGHFLIAVNGEDTPIKYDGSAVSTTTITGSGLTATNLINIAVHKERIWLVEKSSTNAWYLATKAISGTATKFPLGSVFKRGGTLQAIGTISSDSGSGLDDYIVFISSAGEAAVYQGTDPSSASTWSLVGTYRIGEPIGRRCLFNVGGDLIVLTNAGAVSIQKMMSLAEIQSEFAAITYKIQDLFNRAATDYRANFGWQGIVYPGANWVLVNIPRSAESAQFQYVMNAITGSWCKFTGMNANCWAVANGDIYFGGNAGIVYQADNTRQDDGGQITGFGLTAFADYGAPGRLKKFSIIRPLFYANGTLSFRVNINVDFDQSSPAGEVSVAVAAGSSWDTATWDTGVWGGEYLVFKPWKGAGRIGTLGAVAFYVSANGQLCRINAFDVVAQPGGIL